MDNFLYIDACKTSLSVGITPQATKIYISNPSRFPGVIPQGHVLVLVLHPDGLPSTQEIVHCTEIDVDQLAVVRGAQGTAPASWPAGTIVGAYLTAEMLAQIAADVNGHAGSGGAAHAVATTLAAGFMAAADKVKLNGVQAGATAYVHPASHVPGIITQDANNRFASDVEKGNWNAAKNHADSPHAPSDAQKNSDITKGEIEAKLTGAIGSHSHAAYLPLAGGTITGNLVIRNTAPAIQFADTDNSTRQVHCDSNLIGFLNNGGGWSFHSANDGTNTSPNNMIIGGSTHSTDGNVYMPWAGDWLSNVLSRKMGTDPTAEGVGAFALVMGNRGLDLGINGVYAASDLRRMGFFLYQVNHNDPNYTENKMEWRDGGNIGQGAWRFLGPSMGNNVYEWSGGIAQRIY